MSQSRLLLSVSVLSTALTVAAARAPNKGVPARLPGGITLQKAMQLLYGSYNASSGFSSAPVSYDSAALKSSFLKGADTITARPFFLAEANDEGKRKAFLLGYSIPGTEAKPESFFCHACAPLIDAAVYVKDEGTWKPEVVAREIIALGAYGNPPSARFIQIGTQQKGLLLETGDIHQGYTTVVHSILVPWHGTMTDAIDILVEGDNHGNCGPDSVPPAKCFQNKTTLRFVRGGGSFYDLELRTKGMQMEKDDPSHLTSANSIRHMKLADAKYVLTESRAVVSKSAH